MFVHVMLLIFTSARELNNRVESSHVRLVSLVLKSFSLYVFALQHCHQWVFVFFGSVFFRAMGKNRCGSTKKVLRKQKEKSAVGQYATWLHLRIFCIVTI